MKHHHNHFTGFLPATIVVGIIEPIHGGQRKIIVAFSRREVLNDIIDYLNFTMEDDVLSPGASEIDTVKAVKGNLYAEVEIVEVDL